MTRAARPFAWLLLSLAACSDPFLPEPTRHYQDVATGAAHSCAVTTGGDAYCWGKGSDGQLGHKLKANSPVPVLVTGSLTFESVTAGDAHTCGVTFDQRAYCWGWNAFYQLGAAGVIAEAVPNVVRTDERFQALSAGAYHNCGLVLDGRVFCWGYNRWGQAGNGTTTTTIEPTPVASDLRAVAVTSGGFHSCALTSGGSVWCWGANDFGQLGTGTSSVTVSVPARVPAPVPFVAVSAGRTHTCAVATTGVPYCWGSNAHGELGDGVPFRPGLAGPATPTPVLYLADAASISAGVNNTCARSRSGLGWCWGRNDRGQLGIGTVADMSVPTPVYLLPLNLHVGDLLSFTEIAAGGDSHVCGLADGAIFCWGTGPDGQLGGRGPFVTQPQRVRD